VSAYDVALALVGVILLSMVVSTMLRGSWRRYPFVFSYAVFAILSTVFQNALRHYYGPRSPQFVRAYWALDFVATLLVLLVIIHLIRAAMAGHPYRNPVFVGLLLGVVVTAAGSIFLMEAFSRSFTLGRWMTEVGRDYYFSAVLLNAILWCVLVRRNQDKQLFLLTSGLGLKLTGAAMAHALRLAHAPLWLGNNILMVTYMLSIYVWYVALAKVPEPTPVAPLPGRDRRERSPTVT